MNWINGYETKRFQQEMRKQADYYKKNGMSRSQINAMAEYDEDAFREERIYRMHVDGNDVFDVNEETGRARLDEIVFCRDMYDGFNPGYADPDWWFERISDPILYKRIMLLDDVQKLIVAKLSFEGYRPRDIAAEILHIRESAMSQRMDCIRRILSGNEYGCIRGRAGLAES